MFHMLERLCGNDEGIKVPVSQPTTHTFNWHLYMYLYHWSMAIYKSDSTTGDLH
jgi:hypothetical protein